MTTTNDNARVGVVAALKGTPVPARYLLGGAMVNQLGAFVNTFLVLYLVQKGISVSQAGLSLAAYSGGAVVGMLLGGELTHRIGSRNTIALAMGASALLMFSIPWLSRPNQFALLLIGLAVAGLVTQAYRPAAAAMLSDLIPEQNRLMAFSMMHIALNIGAALAPLIAAALILVNWDLLFWFDGVTALLYASLALVFLPRKVDGSPAHDEPTATETTGRPGYLAVFGDRRFVLYLVAIMLKAMVYIQFMVVLPLKLSADGQPTVLYSAILALSATILIFCELAVTSYVQRWPTPVAAGVGIAVLSLGLASFGLSSALISLLVCTAVFVGGLMISSPTMFAYPAKAPATVKGRYIGASQSMFGLGLTLGPALGVLAWNEIGNGAWLLLGIAGLLSAALAVMGMQRDPDPRATSS